MAHKKKRPQAFGLYDGTRVTGHEFVQRFETPEGHPEIGSVEHAEVVARYVLEGQIVDADGLERHDCEAEHMRLLAVVMLSAVGDLRRVDATRDDLVRHGMELGRAWAELQALLSSPVLRDGRQRRQARAAGGAARGERFEERNRLIMAAWQRRDCERSMECYRSIAREMRRKHTLLSDCDVEQAAQRVRKFLSKHKG